MASLQRAEGDWSARLAGTYFLLAEMCEEADDLKWARVAIKLALQVKIDSQGPDMPELARYIELAQRIKDRVLGSISDQPAPADAEAVEQ